MTTRYRVNEPTVAYEEIDGEIVLINFDNGHYHSLNATGAAIFNALRAGATPAHVAEALAVRYDVDGDGLLAAVADFVDALLAHALVVASDGDAAEAPSNGAHEGATNGEHEAFEPPRLESFDDMEEFLLFDPIHDVAESGWPRQPDSKGG